MRHCITTQNLDKKQNYGKKSRRSCQFNTIIRFPKNIIPLIIYKFKDKFIIIRLFLQHCCTLHSWRQWVADCMKDGPWRN